MSGKMGTKFCFGNSPISSGYAIGYFGIAIRLFLIPNLIALASYHVTKMHKIKEDGEAESEAESDAEPEGEAENGTGIHFDKRHHGFPTAIVGLVIVAITLPIQILLVFGIWKRIRPLLCVWMVFAALECLGIVISMILPFVIKKSIVKLWMPTDVSALIMGPIISTCSLALFLHIWFILVIFGAYDHMKEELVYPGPPAKYDEPTVEPTTPKSVEDLHMTLTSNKLNLSRPSSNKRLDLSERKDLAKKNLGLSDPKLDLSDPKKDLSNPKLDLSDPKQDLFNSKEDLLDSKMDLPETELLDPSAPALAQNPVMDLFRPQT